MLYNFAADSFYIMKLCVVLTQYRRVTDGRTAGIAVANTALAMRALHAL